MLKLLSTIKTDISKVGLGTDFLIEALRPESSENIPIRLQEADLYFSNQNDLRNPKMGSKQSVVVATEG